MSLFTRTEPASVDQPRENAVAAEPATVEACAADYEQRTTTSAGLHTSTVTRHTWGRR